MSYRLMSLTVFFLCGISFSSAQELYSISVKDLSTGKLLLQSNSDLPLVPASIQKMLTCYVAFDKLGEDYVYNTKIYLQGEVDHGVLNGDLIIEGSGDPSFASSHFNQTPEAVFSLIHKKLLQEGINCIDGRLIIDASIFGTHVVPPTWAWYDLGNYYASGAWGLNFRDNRNHLTFQLQKDGGKPVLISHSGPQSLRYINELSSGPEGSGDGSYIYGGPNQNVRFVRGTLPRGEGHFVIKGSLPEPATTFAYDLINYLNDRGLQIEGLDVTYIPYRRSEDRHIGTIQSPPLSDLITIALRESDNLYCEAFLRTVAAKRDYDSALDEWQTIIRSVFGLDLFPYDGAGLSSFNRVSTDQMVHIIEKINRDHPQFWNLMPDLHMTSLGSHLRQTQAKVKSGYMENVRTYTGIIQKRFAFCVMYNGPKNKTSAIKKKMGQQLLEAVSNN